MEEEHLLHAKNIKDIQREGKGMFLMMIKLAEEDERHQQILKEYNENLQKKLEETPIKMTEFKVSYKPHTNFGPPEAIFEHH